MTVVRKLDAGRPSSRAGCALAFLLATAVNVQGQNMRAHPGVEAQAKLLQDNNRKTYRALADGFLRPRAWVLRSWRQCVVSVSINFPHPSAALLKTSWCTRRCSIARVMRSSPGRSIQARANQSGFGLENAFWTNQRRCHRC